MPGVEIHAQVLESALTRAVLAQPNYAIAVEFLAALILGLLVIIFTPNLGPVRLVDRRRAVCVGPDRHVLVFLHAVSPADRLHLSPDVDDRDLPHADLFELRPRTGAAEADSYGLCPVHVARAGRATRPVAGKARARWRGARDDDHVLRCPRLHRHLGDLQARSAGPHRPDEPLPDAAHQRDPGAQGHRRQIYGRRDHGVLERAAR